MQTGPHRQGTNHLPVLPAAAFWDCAQHHCSIFLTPPHSRFDSAIVSLFYPSCPLPSPPLRLPIPGSIPICTASSCTKPRLGWIKLFCSACCSQPSITTPALSFHPFMSQPPLNPCEITFPSHALCFQILFSLGCCLYLRLATLLLL